MSEQSDQQPEKKEQAKEKSKIQTEFDKVLEKTENEISTKYSGEFDQMLHSDEWTIADQTLKYHMLTRTEVGKFRALQDIDIDEKKDWTGFTTNVCDKACLLIEGMTPEQFDKLPYYKLENLISAWSMRANRGFP